MYAQLGDIIFEPVNSFASFSESEEAIWAKHEPITGYPTLQPTGNNLREINISINLRQEFIDIKTAVSSLRAILRTHKVSTLIWGNGDVEGDFVMTGMSRGIEQQDEKGNIYDITINLNLTEYNPEDTEANKANAARKNATAVDGKAKPVINAKKNKLTKKQQVVALLTKVKRYQAILYNLTVVPGNDIANGNITGLLNHMSTNCTALKSISDEVGLGTDNSIDFKNAVSSTKTAIDDLKVFTPVTGGNVTQFNTQKNVLRQSVLGLSPFGSVFTKRVVTRRP